MHDPFPHTYSVDSDASIRKGSHKNAAYSILYQLLLMVSLSDILVHPRKELPLQLVELKHSQLHRLVF